VYICIRNGEGEEEEEELDTVEMDIHVYKRKLLVKRNAEPPLSPFCGDDGRTDGRTDEFGHDGGGGGVQQPRKAPENDE
jgi:hypothetical protein